MCFHLQLYLEFLGSIDIMLKTTNLQMKVDEDRSSLKKNLRKPKLKIKVQQVKGETLTPQVSLQKLDLKIKIEHIKEQINLQKPNQKVEEGIYILDIQLKTQKILRLWFNLIIYSPKCWITKIFKNNGSTRLHKSFLYISSNNLHNNKNC